MPVEIKEIVIRAVLTEEGKASTTLGNHISDKESLVQECVTQVLKIIKKQNYR